MPLHFHHSGLQTMSGMPSGKQFLPDCKRSVPDWQRSLTDSADSDKQEVFLSDIWKQHHYMLSGLPFAVLVVMFAVPLLLIFLKEPLTNLVEKKKKILPEQKGMFFVQSFFELFEVLLSYLSNTLSFLRIGAFAVSHAAMMEVVLMLAGATEGGSPNWIVVVLGNIFVCAMEGLIVGIQVLRLEYYEIFSRFYAGNGREFKPFRKKS